MTGEYIMMSADNYYLITKHPLGGFAVLMGFESWPEDIILSATERDTQYPTFSEAEDYALNEYSEYGVRVSADAEEERIAQEGGHSKLSLSQIQEKIEKYHESHLAFTPCTCKEISDWFQQSSVD